MYILSLVGIQVRKSQMFEPEKVFTVNSYSMEDISMIICFLSFVFLKACTLGKHKHI